MLYDSLDPLIRPLALDEMGMSLRPECIEKVVELTQDETTPGFTRIKAIEAWKTASERGQCGVAAHPGGQAGVAVDVSDGTADRGGAGVAEDRANAGNGEDFGERAGPEGTGDGADRSGAHAPVIRQRGMRG